MGTGDFTIEAIVRNIPMDKSMLTLISKRTTSTNGFALMVNTIDGITFHAEIGKKKYQIDASALEDGGCHSLAIKRFGSELSIYIDGISYSVGSNITNINTTTDLVIGNDGTSVHNHFEGSIEELRFWRVARTDSDIFDWNIKCIAPSTSGLLACWNIEENAGQFFHDAAQVKHHAYLGNSFSADGEDPVWIPNECLEGCCAAHASFTCSNTTPLAAQFVNFISTSTNAASYEWSVDNQVIATTSNMQHSFGLGVFIVTLKVSNQDEGGCDSYYSQVIEVNSKTASFCGEEEFTTPEIELIEELESFNSYSPLPTIKMYDRFGNRYLPDDVTYPVTKSVGSVPYSCSCGIFELFFEDMQYNRAFGFDDPTLGTDRRAVACRVFEDLSILVDPTSSLGANLVKIQVKKSEGKAPSESTPVNALDAGVLAAAGPYLIQGYTTGIIDGLVYKTITSGSNAIANTPGWNPNSYHGSMRVDFDLNDFFLNNPTWVGVTPSNQYDLYTVLLHESFHILGFYSLIDAENSTNLSKLNGSQVYNRYDTYLETASGVPFIDPITGILNPTSDFFGIGGNCSADVIFEGTSNPTQEVYRPSPWNFSTLSHFNCNSSNANGCAINNGYTMNACIAAGDMQRAPNQAEYSTLCDIGYQLSTTYGVSSLGTPSNNVPYQTYTMCNPACAVAGIDDNLTSTISVAAGASVYINATGPTGFTTNDNNPSNSYNSTTLLSTFGTISNVTATGFTFTPNPSFAGTAIIQYHPTCTGGINGSSALIFITVTPIVLACNIPYGACNILCNGDLEDAIYNPSNPAQHNLSNFSAYYKTSSSRHDNFSNSSDIFDFDAAGNLISLNPSSHGVYSAFSSCEPGFGVSVGGIPLPVDFANGNRKYIGLGVWWQFGEDFNLHLSEPLTPSPSGTNNYRLGFWAFSTCSDIDIRMALSEDVPCFGTGGSATPKSNVYDAVSTYFPNGTSGGGFNQCTSYAVGSNQGLTPTATFDLGVPVNTSDGWEYFTMDFHVTPANLDEVIFSASTMGAAYNRYILIDEITIEPLVPQLTINSTITGTACPDNKVIVEYNICSDVPVSGVDLEVQLPVASGLSFTNAILPNAINLTNGKILGLDLGIGSNPLCTLVKAEVLIPGGASAPNTHNIFMDVTGGVSCTSTASNLNTSLDIIQGSTLSISVVPSLPGPFTIPDNFTVDVIVTNTGSNDIQNIVVDLPTGIHSLGLTYSFTPTTIPSILAGGSSTITSIPISVLGPCGDAQICAEIVSADGSCNLPDACSPLIEILGSSTISFPIEIEGISTNDIDYPSSIATGNDGSFYITGLYNQDINFITSTGTNQLNHNAPCTSIFIAKYDACGFTWAKEIPACVLLSLYYSPKVVVDANNNIYLGFSFEGSFGHIIGGNSVINTSIGAADIGIMKLAPNGDALWFLNDGGIENEILADIDIYENTPNNQIVIAGIIIESQPFSSSAATLPTLTGNSTSIAGAVFPYHEMSDADAWGSVGGTTFTASYTENPTASFLPKWAKFIDVAVSPTTSNNYIPTQVHQLEIDNSGNIYVLGATYQDFQFTNKNTNNANGLPGLAMGTNTDIDHFVISYDNTGNENWAGLYGTNNLDILSGLGYDLETPNLPGSMKIDNNGNGYLGIQMAKGAIGCPSTIPTVNDFGHFGINLLKVDLNNGNLLWSRALATAECKDHNVGQLSAVGDALIGNHTFHPNIAINSIGDVFVSGNFMLETLNSGTPYVDEFTDIDFYSNQPYGQSFDYTVMESYIQGVGTEHVGKFIEKFNSSGTFQWVLTNKTFVRTISGNGGDPFIPSSMEITTNNDIMFSFAMVGELDMYGSIYTGLGGDGYITHIHDQGTGGVYAKPQSSNNNMSQNKDQSTKLLNTSNYIIQNNITTKLYPNPTTGRLTLEISSDGEENQIERINIYDVRGKLIQQVQISDETQNKYELNLEAQLSGVYFVEMMVNQELITKRVILMN